MEEQLTTKQVADALKVSESSVKRWCDRGAIPTTRTVGGHRRIPKDGFLDFLQSTDRQAELPDTAEVDVEPTDEANVSLDALFERFLTALSDGREGVCRQTLVDVFRQGNSFAFIADQFVAKALHKIGDHWDCGELDVYQERRGCEICSRVLHEFRKLLPTPGKNAPLALGGAPAGDNYTIANQLIELVLQECGWQASNLGSNLPLTTIVAAAKRHRPQMVWLSVSHLEDRGQFLSDYERFADELPKDSLLVLGGRALDDHLRPKLRYTGFCDNLQQLTSLAKAVGGRNVSLTNI